MKQENNKPKPWLDIKGEPLSDDKLKEISKTWDESTWEEYLQSLETGLTETLFEFKEFRRPCDSSSITPNSSQSDSHPPAHKEPAFKFLPHAWKQLTSKQRRILRLLYRNGDSITELAQSNGVTMSAIISLRNRAVETLKSEMTKVKVSLRKENRR